MMDGRPAYFGDDFGQKIDLTVRIREILRNYPEGTSIFKELVQNADDAGATEVAFCLDRRQHSTEHLAYNKMDKFQGPALVVYNNATFSDADFQSIQRIGDSLKKDASKGWKTGRFGVGFNSVYHLTDLPAFVSGSHLVFFDPQACHLPNVNPSNPGKMIDFVAHPKLVLNYPDQVAPFRVFGCDFTRPFDGTVFRLALRSEEHARESRLSHRPQSPDQMMKMLTEFEDSIHLVLLFLRNVSGIKLMVWEQGESEPTVFCEASVSSLTEDIRAKRSLQTSMLSGAGDERPHFDLKGHACDYTVDIAITKPGRPTENVRYMIANQLGGGECSRIANDPANASQRLVPWGGVALRVPNPESVSAAEEGLAFCFLPLPTHTYLPVHVNGYFELSSNRRDVWFGEGLSGDGLLRAQWNIALLREVVAPCYARALMALTDKITIKPELHATLLPNMVPPAPWDTVAQSVLALVRGEPCLFSPVAGGGAWVAPKEAVIVKRSTVDYEQFVQWLQQDGVPVVSTLSEQAEDVLVKLGAVPAFLKPTTLRSVYRQRSSTHSESQDAIKALLSFMFSDLNQKTLGQLVGVKLLPIGDGSLGSIREAETKNLGNAASLDYLCSMGFSRTHSKVALRLTGGDDVEAALNWLFANPNPTSLTSDAHEDESISYFLPTSDERRILSRAQKFFVNVDALPEVAVKLLSSAIAQQELNVRPIDMDVFEDLLSAVLPPEWYGKSSVSWEPEKEAYRDFDEEWFRLLWRYLGPSDRLRNLQDKWPLLPTETNVLCLLSPASGVVSPELLPPSCFSALIKMGVPVLLKNLFATTQPHADVWNFVHQPTPGGVLSCLAKLCEAPELEVKRAFRSVSRSERTQLKVFLLSDSCDDLDDTQKMVFTKLPIFEGATPVNHRDEWDVAWADSNDSGSDLSGFLPVFVGLYSASKRSMRVVCPGIKWNFLDDNFLTVDGYDKSMIDALLRLNVRVISRPRWFADHLIPRIENLPSTSRIDFVCELLQEFGALLADDHDGELARKIETSAIFPAMSGDVKRIIDLFDPDIDEFSKIMDGSFFPAIELQDPQPLSVLRSLGLQRHLSRRSVLDLACSLDADQTRILQDSSGSADETEGVKSRAMEFFRYLDTHIDQLVSVSATPVRVQKRNIKTKGLKLWRTMVGDESGSKESHAEQTGEDERKVIELSEIKDFVAKLNVIAWVPVSEHSPHPSIPWYREDPRIVVAAPTQARLPKDLGLCSSQFYVVGLPIHSDALRSKFQWCEPIAVEVVARQLRAIALHATETPGDRLQSQVVWPIMFEIYKRLSSFFEREVVPEKRSAVLSSLSGDLNYVWVGASFVAPHRVALSTAVNAEPYLYGTPSELVHFRPFLKAIGVRERFTMNDYVNALAEMNSKFTQSLPGAAQECARTLSKDELVSAIGLVQLISDTLAHHSDYELYVPDASGCLARSVNLTFDDAPWLDKRDIDLTTIQLVHPKISNEVAMKMGAKSLRGQLLHANQSESLHFSMGGEVQAFGQSEALTKRIAHILDQYPDGPHIISELIQNADDAGATRVCLLYSDVVYGTSSLLSPAMAKWQGPALYCYNDAEFQDSDFISLAQIGQGGKMQKVSTTGRFGLGFNSVYHFTDLPSILSAKSLVMFDPHATHLPGITPANPGIKVRFVDSSLPKQFPDQFEPFKLFGCDLTSHFHGSLFRFPLRHEGLAPSSEIKQRAYAKEQICDLFESFRTTIADAMIFLRNVRKVDVMIQLSREEAPELLYSAEVPAAERGDAWRQIERFIAGSAGSRASGRREASNSSKRAFYSRLALTSAAELPSVTQTLHIKTEERSDIAELFSRGQEQADASLQTRQCDPGWTSRVDEFLVCNQIGGGRARDMACAPENESLKLIPWVGIAGRLQDQIVDGRAFCFLPLPVKTGLPVHVNGYFELSSNRRDIWHGDDLSGDGKLRSEWNSALLSDAIAPAYATFLQAAKQLCGRSKSSVYYSLFPSKLPSGPWEALVRALFVSVRDKQVLWSSPSSTRNTDKSVTPASSVLVDDRVNEWEVLEGSLNAVFIDTVRVPLQLREIMTRLDAVQGTFTPAFFRKFVRSGRFLPSLDSVKVSKVIEFCLSDCRDDAARAELDKLPIVPALDGSFRPLVMYSHAQDQPSDFASSLFFANEEEQRLLDGFRSQLVSYQFKALFEAEPSVQKESNLFDTELTIISNLFLPLILPPDWCGQERREVFLWEPTTQVKHPSREWLRLWWEYVDSVLDEASGERESNMALDAIEKWPLLPVTLSEAGPTSVLIHAGDRSKVAVIWHPASRLPVEVTRDVPGVLTKLGLATIDPTLVKGRQTVTWLIKREVLFSMDLDGFLSALSYRLKRDTRGRSVHQLFARLENENVMALEEFVTSNGIGGVSDKNGELLRSLPIFRVHPDVGHDSNGSGFQSLDGGAKLPGDDADPRVLGSTFFMAPENSTTRSFLREARVEEWGGTKILLEHFFPRLNDLQSQEHIAHLIDSVIQNTLLEFPFHQRQDSKFRDALRSLPIIPTRKRQLRRIADLYDPNNRDLSELVGPNSLPDEPFSGEEIVSVLRTLGLRGSLSCHAILESARSVEAMALDMDSRDDAYKKAQSLVKVVNRSFDEMASAFPDRAGSNTAGDAVETLEDLVEKLRETRWLPIHGTPLRSFMPWRVVAGPDGDLFASATTTRPEHDAWSCSTSYSILKGQLHSTVLVAGFGWNEAVDATTVATQLAAVGELVRSSTRIDVSSPDFKLLMQETQRLYQALDAATSDENLDRLRDVLASAAWVWTGTTFVTIDQVALEADGDLEPLLFAAPPEVLVPRSLLAAFGLKIRFEPIDYVMALKSLSEGESVVTPEQKTTCLKLLELIANAVSTGDSNSSFSQGLLLLDEKDKFVPARDLVCDDMEWNESSEARRGCRFVSRSVPRDVALKLGARSLHSKLAETSVSSSQVTCPGVNALKAILPMRDRWFREFFAEILLAVERFGGSQVEFFADFRKHPAQRIIQPSFQGLQEEAICVHIHDLVLSTHDVNALFAGEMSRPGLLTGFVFSDCLQILSGDGFYVMDPTRKFLSASSDANSSNGLARRYDILNQEFTRYPDQLLPFATLPSCPGNISGGTRGTLLRFPWRKEASSLSNYLLSERGVDSFVRYVRSELADCLVFTESVHRVALWSLGKGSEFTVHAHGEAALENPEVTLKRRNATRQNSDWKKKFSFHSFFKAPIVPENQVEFLIKVELENKRYKDTWLLSDVMAAGRSRDLAGTPVHEVLNSTPYVGVACRLFRNGDVAPVVKGKLFRIVKTDQDVGLPIHINGCFKKNLSDSLVQFTSARSGMNDEQSISTHWNRVLLEDGVVEAYAKMLQTAKLKFENSVPKAFYRVWPSAVQASNFVAAQTQLLLYPRLDLQQFFLCTDGVFRTLGGGYVVDMAGMDLQVVSFAQLNFPSFDIPSAILEDAKRLLPLRVASLSPKTMRRFLRTSRVADLHASMCLSLLEYCVSDLTFPLPGEEHPVWAEFQGLPLLPLQNGSVGVLGTNQRGCYVLGSFNQIQLLTPKANMFVALEARQRLHLYFSDPRFVAQMGLSQFSIKTLSDNIHCVLPGAWKGCPIIDWSPETIPSHVTRLWMYRFWNEVRFERRSLQYFRDWPLIPVQGSRLLSCGKPDAAICIWDKAFDRSLRDHLSEGFTSEARDHDEKLVEFESERRRLRELAAEKLVREERQELFRIDETDLLENVAYGEPDDADGQLEEQFDAQATETADTEAREGDVGQTADLNPNSSLEENITGTIDDIQALDQGREVVETVGAEPPVQLPPDTVGDIVPAIAETAEFCSRETLHNLLLRLNAPLVELAYLSGQEADIIPSSREAAIAVLDGISSTDAGMITWATLSAEDATRLAEYFGDHSLRHGGFNRLHLDRLKCLPIFVNICGAPCALDRGEHFLVPAEIDLTAIPLPPNARQRFMLPNPRLGAFYKDLGVEDMSYGKLLVSLLPFFGQFLPDQRESILRLIKVHWASLRGEAHVLDVLRSTALFVSEDGSYKCADSFLDPRNKVLKALYADVPGSFPLEPTYSSDDWLNLMGEIGLRSEITVDLFIECAQRLEGIFANKASLSVEDEAKINTLHEFFVQNFDKYDRSRVFFERIASIRFVPAIRYENTVSGREESSALTSRTVLTTYAECATPDDQALVFSCMPILATSALPPRVLWSRLGLQSPPPKSVVLQHLFHIVERASQSTIAESWQFFVPVVDIFQAIFKYLQDEWDHVTHEERNKLTNAPIIPVGSHLVKGNRLFFHLADNLAPLMYEVPRVFGAYDRLFRHLGSKDAPDIQDYVLLLQDLSEECGGSALNLNELLSVARVVNLLSDSIADQNKTLTTEALKLLYLPSTESVMCQALQMAHDDAPWICARVDLTELQVVHPRVTSDRCGVLGVKGISHVVSEELEPECHVDVRVQQPREVQTINAVIASQQFGNGLRTLISVQQQKSASAGNIDFEDLDRRIVGLAMYQIRAVSTLKSRFVAKLGHPVRHVDVTKESVATGSISFVDMANKVIYVAVDTLAAHEGVRITQVVASCMNQLLGGVVQDCSAMESILSSNTLDIQPLLRFLHIHEDPALIMENLRGLSGEPLTDSDLVAVELAPLRSLYIGEVVAVELDGGLRYAKIMKEQSSPSGINQFEVRIRQAEVKWFPATQIYSFKSSRGLARPGVASVQDRNRAFVERLALAGAATGSTAAASPSPAQALPTSVVVHGDGASQVAGVVSAVTVVSAVNDLLSKLNLSLDTTYEELIAENLRLQRRVDQAEEGRRLASAQVEDALREKKDAQDTLTCMICLENKVDRVLIPCGHIYCGSCIGQLPRQTCPVCRQAISATSAFHVPS